MTRRAALTAVAAATMLSGCVAAAVVPVLAGGTIGKRRLAAHHAKGEAVTRQAASTATVSLLPAGSVLPPPSPGMTAAPPLAFPPDAETGWRALVRYVAQRMVGHDGQNVVPGIDPLGAAPCTGPATVVLDADLAAAGVASRDIAVTALNALRTMGVAVVFAGDFARGSRAMIAEAGFGKAVQGKNLFATTGAARDAMIAQGLCVIAIGGARAGDFPGTEPGVAWPWGAGWFLIPSAATSPPATRPATPTETAAKP